MAPRSPQIPVARLPRFIAVQLRDEQWAQLETEAHYGNRLAPAVRELLEASVNQYLARLQMEENAPKASVSKLRLERIHQSSIALVKLLTPPRQTETDAVGTAHALSLLMTELTTRRLYDPLDNSLVEIRGPLNNLSAAAERAIVLLENPDNQLLKGEAIEDWLLAVFGVLSAESPSHCA